MRSNESTEMYLETIYVLEQEHTHAHVVDIASRLGISKPSVSKAMNHLKADELIVKESYGTITLTQQGRALAERVYYHHKLITRFLEQSLELCSSEAAENACRMEHIVSEEMIMAIEKYLEKQDIVVD